MSHPTPSIVNALTVDLEDWIQSVYDHNHELTGGFRRNTERILEMLDARGARATFFVLGLAAAKAPALIRRLHAEGHEIQSHGYGHRPVFSQTPAEFKNDLLRCKRLLEDLVGAEVFAYRAPMFSIGPATPWAMDVLAECGFRWDSSLFPVKMRRYGHSGIPRGLFRLTSAPGHEIVELSVASWQLGPMRLPAGGGGYLRLLPLEVFRRAIRQLNAHGSPAVLYMHPYELAPEEFARLPVKVPFGLRLKQGLGRRRFAARVGRLLDEFRFGRLADAVPATGHLPSLDWPFARNLHAMPDDGPARSVRPRVAYGPAASSA